MNEYRSMDGIKMVSPIFILGLNRNGTTWLQNILCNHKDIVGAQHKAHWGIHESTICRHIRYWGNLQDTYQFIKFLELYSHGDYFKLVKGNKDYFYKHPPEDFTDFFFEMMDNYAKKENAEYWITKLDPLFYEFPDMLQKFIKKAKNRYGTVKYIGIKRNYQDVLKSAINMQGKTHKTHNKLIKREKFVLLHIISYLYFYKSINKIISKENGISIKFDDLKNEKSVTLKKMGTYLNLSFDIELFNIKYARNSSFKGGTSKIIVPSCEEKILLNILLPIFQYCTFLTCLTQHLFLHFKKTPKKCPLYFRLIKLEKCKEKFKQELDKNGYVGLKQILFEDEYQDE